MMTWIMMTWINEIIEEGHMIQRGDIIICSAPGGAKPGETVRYSADFGSLSVIPFELG